MNGIFLKNKEIFWQFCENVRYLHVLLNFIIASEIAMKRERKNKFCIQEN